MKTIFHIGRDAQGFPRFGVMNDYKAPHALRGTPQRPRHSRKGIRKLFKGHRP